jgi:ABC-2 type transport system ATP-binding protein
VAIPILDMQGMNKIYPGGIHAVTDLDYAVAPGSISALLGPNGAGKSTTMGMICGLCIPTSGTIFFNGEDVSPASFEYRKRIGVVSQHFNLDLDLTVYQNLKIHALLYTMKKAVYEPRIQELVAFSGLESRETSVVRTLSGGLKRRLQIVRAVLHDPDLVVLDEPTTGLDPVGREAVWGLIKTLNRNGKTVLFSTHYMEEAHRHAGRVSIMHRGRIMADGAADELMKNLGKSTLDDVFIALTGERLEA